MPTTESLTDTIAAFKQSLNVSPEQARDIERNTRDQRLSTLWFSVRRFRITASMFGSVLSRRKDTPPDSLVLRIIQPKQFSTAATKYGIENEKVALEHYVTYQHNNGHPDLFVSESGFLINSDYCFLGASPDGAVHDPADSKKPFGFLEIKCPYKNQNQTPEEACSIPSFFCNKDVTTGLLNLKQNHHYFSQVQGRMAIGNRSWCDFVVYTKKGISIQRICFDEQFWHNKLLPKLSSFYDNCVTPEIVSPLFIPLVFLCEI